MKRIFFRADGNINIGLGHVIRSCALAGMLKDIFECHFIIRNPSVALEMEILKSCRYIHKLADDDSYLQEAEKLTQLISNDAIVVLDGYHFDTIYQQIFRSNGNKIVCIDDISSYHFVADVIINHAGGFTDADYSKDAGTKIYLGPKYALVRREFLQPAVPPEKRQKKVLISLGGADKNNTSVDVLNILQQLGVTYPCEVVIGSAYEHRESLEALIASLSFSVNIHSNLDAARMASLMQECYYAICPPSSVSYEFSLIKGIMYNVVIADNQKRIHHFLVENGLAFDITLLPELKQHQHKEQEILQRQALLFDGLSPARLISIFLVLAYQDEYSVRSSNEQDALLLYNWANDKQVRENSFNPKQIALEDHLNWYKRKLEAKSSYIYIFEDKRSNAIGQVRFDMHEGTAVIDYSIDSQYRNKGMGLIMLALASAKLLGEVPVHTLEGTVKKTNLASSNVFRKLSFCESEAPGGDLLFYSFKK